MPITQDRLIALVHIVDQALSFQENVKSQVRTELDAAINDFHALAGPNNALACDLLARLQAIDSLVSSPIISQTALTTLIHEREHFKANEKRNTRSARAMRNFRQKDKTPPCDNQS